MLKKLMKYEFRALRRNILAMYIAMIGASVLAMSCLFLIRHTVRQAGTLVDSLVLIGSIPIFALMLIAIVVLAAIALLNLAIRYYKSCFTDEGYLTFVLPVDTDTLLVSKIFTAWIFTMATIAVTFLSILVALSPALFESGVLEAFRSLYNFFYGAIPDKDLVLSFILFLLSLIVSPITAIALAYTAISLGCAVFKKNRVFGCILMYLAISFGLSTIRSILSVLFLPITIQPILDDNSFWIMHFSSIASLIFNILLTIAGYFTTRHLVKNKLNLV